MKKDNYALLKKFCLDMGINLFGVADVSLIKKDFLLDPVLLEKLDRGICLGVRLSSGILDEISSQPTKIYYYHYRQVNALLDQAALRLTNFIQGKGYEAVPIPASQVVDWEKQSAHLSHRKIGFLAGLGWIGRNNLLVNKKLGSQFRLVTILTSMPLKTDKPVKDNCGACHLCVRACPAGAIKENSGEFEMSKCVDKLREFHKKHIVEQYICGVCIRVCRGRM